MSKLLDAVNSLLVSIGEEIVSDLSEPSTLMAKQTLDFVVGELPYDTEDFPMDYEEFPQAIYNYVVVKASRKFQTSAVSSETLHEFTKEDEASAKRLIIRKKIIPKALMREVEEELEELLSFANKVPKTLKENMALLKLQGLLFANPEEYVISQEQVENAYTDFKKRLIINREVPSEVIENIRKHYFARYGFTGIIPSETIVGTKIPQLLIEMGAFEFQKSILVADAYVISQEERNQDEMDFRIALVANRMYPQELYDKCLLEFVDTYGITPSELTSLMEDYLRTKTCYRLQNILIPTELQRPISSEDMDNAEAMLMTNLVVPKALYQRILSEVKLELSIDPEVPLEEIPAEVKSYAKIKAAMLQQPTAIIHPVKYVITADMVIRAKAIALQSLPKLSLMDSTGVSRLVDRTSLPSVTTAGTGTTYYRLGVSDGTSTDN